MSRRPPPVREREDSSDDELFSDPSDFGSNASDNSEGEGDDLMDAEMFKADLRRDARLDNYDRTMLGDSTDDDNDDYGYHQQITRQLDERDENVKKRRRGAFLLGAPGDDGDPLLHSQDDLHHLIEPAVDDIALQELNMPADQIVMQPGARPTIQKKFLAVLLSCEDDDGHLIYEDRINSMAEENKSSFQVDFQHLVEQEPVVADLLLKSPKDMLSIMEDQANRLINLRYPNYSLISEYCNLRFTNVGQHVKLVDIRHDHMNRFMSIHGVVVRRSQVCPKLQTAVYQCNRCGLNLPGIQQQLVGRTPAPNLRCAQPDCQSKSMRVNYVHSVFHNYQRLVIQEAPGAVQAGRIPRQVEVVVFDDLIDACLPGEEIEVIGYLQLIQDNSLNIQTGFPVFDTTIVANNILKKKSKSFSTNDVITEHDIRLIEDLARSPNIQDFIIQSIAPSIYGHLDIKTAIACSLFAGCAKELKSKARLRGDINVLLVGDPGVAKSQFLKYTEKIGHRAVYTTGKGASAVGLTATVQRDKFTGEWTLEGGALVLADQGTCLIDEFDKMSDQDRTSIHEAMEQQTISISKAGIVCTLKARCGVIAAANPIGGNYDNSLTFQEQVDLTEPILSRFDILCVVRDKIDRQNDERLARFITATHMPANTLHTANQMGENGTEEFNVAARSNDQSSEDDLTMDQMRERGYMTQKLLAKYILHARAVSTPSLKNINNDKIVDLYKKLRRAAQRSGGIQITPRHLESLLRIAEAHAKMRLAQFVDNDDLDRAIHVVLDSFFQSQKLTIRQEFERQFSLYSSKQENRNGLILDVIKTMVTETITNRQVLGLTYEEAIVQPVTLKEQLIYTRCVNQYGNVSLTPFFNSELFQSTPGAEYDEDSRSVIWSAQ